MLKTKFSRLPLRDRLLLYSHIDENGCWLWQGTKFKNTGYGQITHNKKIYSAHRLSLHVFKGFELDSPLYVLHKCDIKACLNPDHLYAGTVQDNANDARDRYLLRRGSKHHHAKLNEAKVMQIFSYFREGLTPRNIAAKFNVDVSTINLIKRRKIWTHVRENLNETK